MEKTTTLDSQNEFAVDETTVVAPKKSRAKRGSKVVTKAKGDETTTKPLPKKVVLRNTLGEEVPSSDYFYKGVVSSGFEGTCGKPVDREELLAVFNKVFKPADKILFYRQLDKEVYLVIIPIKYSTEIGDSQNSIEGDFQKHAISFLNEGSVNTDTLRKKLEQINKFVKYSDR